MVFSEVQRTLVKSPPELWAELSDPAALARHLGELGEIRITKTKSEERVEWEADGATGTVLIKASGWGTKVTLSATREIEEPKVEPEVEPTIATAESTLVPEEPEIEADPEPAVESRRGFFSRLFRRRDTPAHTPAEQAPTLDPPSDEAAPEPEPAAGEEPQAAHVDEPSGPPAGIAAELKAAEEAATEAMAAVLTATLDRLGAAHHRPFSRA